MDYICPECDIYFDNQIACEEDFKCQYCGCELNPAVAEEEGD